jgi:uroporphyrinogen-III synthase
LKPNIILTRDEEGNAEWAARLHAAGIRTTELPCIRIVPLPAALPPTADWIVFTSSAGVRHAPRRPKVKVAVIGPFTADAAGHYDFMPSSPDSRTLAAEFPDPAGRTIVLARSDLADAELADLLTARGALVIDARVYTTEPITDPASVPDNATVLFASPSAVTGLIARTGRTDLPAIAFGASVTAALRAAGFTDITEAPSPDLDSVIKMLG